ncbi:MAG: tetratricopeptide repeat protein [Bacteroidia bacterium]
MAKLALLFILKAQQLPFLWGPEALHTQAELAGFHGARSWGRQQALLYSEALPMVVPQPPPSEIVPLWEKYAQFDLLRASAPAELRAYALAETPSYRSQLAQFYAAKYAFLRRAYGEVLDYLAGTQPQDFPPALRAEMQFMEGYAAYAQGDQGRALARLRPLTEKLGPFHDAANYYVGLIYYARGDWKAAAEYLQAVQTRPPYAQEAPLWLAYALAQAGDIEGLEAQAERWISLTPPPAHADTLWSFVAVTLAYHRRCASAERYAKLVEANRLVRFWLGWCAYQQRQDSLALQTWESLLGVQDSLTAWARYGCAQALIRLNQPEEALGMLRQIPPSMRPPAPEALWLSAQLSWQLRLWASGREALQSYQRLPGLPRQLEAQRWLAEFYAAERQYAEALRLLDSLRDPSLQEPRQRLRLLAGLQALYEKAYTEAESLFAQSARIGGPHSATALFWQAEALYRQGSLTKAIAAYQAFLRHPQSSQSAYFWEAQLALAWSHLQLHASEEALRISQLVRQKAPASYRPLASFIAAGALYLQKRYTEALGLYEQLLHSSLPSAQVRYHLAQTLARLERYGEAEQVLREVPPQAPGADAALYLRAELCALWLNRPGCTKEAAELLLRHFPASPKAPLARARLGLALAELGDKAAALQTLRQTLETATHLPEAVRLAMEGLRNLLSPAEFDTLYQNFLRRLPPTSEMRLSLERDRLAQLREAGQWASLRTEALRIRQAYPALEAEALLALGLACENLGDTAAALTSYQALAAFPDYALRAWEKLARIYQSQNRINEAWAAQESLLRWLPSAGPLRTEGLFVWAELAVALGRADTALEAFRVLIADPFLRPWYRQKALLTYALLQEKMGQSDSALFYLRQVQNLNKNELAAEALFHEARLLFAQGRLEEARRPIYRLRDELPDYTEARARAYLILAQIQIKEKKFKSVRPLLASLIENAPTEEIRRQAQALRDSLPPDTLPPDKPKKPTKRPRPRSDK